MATPLIYIHLDQNDRRVFDHGLSDDVERFAFISFFEHVERDFTKNRRPRTGNGRVALWNKCSRSYWLRHARTSQPLPPILRPTWTPPVAHPPLPPPTQPPNPPTPKTPVLSLVAPILSSVTSIAPVNAPPLHPLKLVAPVPGGTIDITPVEQHLDQGTKIVREGNLDELTHDLERPAKRRLTNIGGERCPQFVLYNSVDGKERSKNCHTLPPAREQRLFVQRVLGGNWRFAKTLSQRSLRAPKQGSKAGFPDVSTFLFAKVDDAGIIEDRVAVKCKDVSIKADASQGQVEREATAANAIRATGCRHLQHHLHLGEHKENQTLNFHLEGHNDQDAWQLNYQISQYAPHDDLHTLIRNHEKAKQVIPEHFCWFVFQSIVEALITCQTGYCGEIHPTPLEPTSRRPGWRRILHLDIKAENIFLAGPDSKYAFYQQPVLGDLATALCLHPNHVQRKNQLSSVRFEGKQYMQAPERCMQYKKSKDYAPATWDLDHSTDIYTLGLLIRYMMMCTRVTPEKPIDTYLGKLEADAFAAEAKGLPNVKEYQFKDNNYPSVYSPALKDTALRCLAFRQRYDPSKPSKKYRPTLFELRDIIEKHLSALDSKHLKDVETTQSDPRNTYRVLFPEEDQRFAIGAETQPIPPVNISQLVDREAKDSDKQNAHEVWSSYRNQYESGSGENASPSTSSMEIILDDLNARARTQLTEMTKNVGDVSARQTVFNALQHANNTMLKCINPTSTFKQLRQKLRSDFFAPAKKREMLTQFLGCSKEIMTELTNEAEKLQKSKDQVEEEIAAAQETLRSAQGADVRDEAKVDRLTVELKYLVDKKDLKTSEEAVLQDKIASVKLFREAAELGEALLVLGEEFWPSGDISQEEEHWMPEVSPIHRGVWEYFFARPDGVFE